MTFRKKRCIQGTSLMEVMLATFLVAAAAAVMSASMPVANISRGRANNLNKAVSVAEKELEAIRGAGYSNCTASQLSSFSLIDSTTTVSTNTYTFTNVDRASNDNVATVLPSGAGYVTIEQADLDLRKVTVKVTWVERGTTRSYTLGTLVANL